MKDVKRRGINLRTTVKQQVKELYEYFQEEENPIQPEHLYQEIYGTRDIYIQEQIRKNY